MITKRLKNILQIKKYINSLKLIVIVPNIIHNAFGIVHIARLKLDKHFKFYLVENTFILI